MLAICFEVACEDVVALIGIGNGDCAQQLISQTKCLLLWDRDPAIMQRFLACGDYTEEISSGRLQLFLGADILRIRNRDVTILEHPFSQKLYPNEVALCRDSPDKSTVFVVEGELFVSDISEALIKRGYSVYTWDTMRLNVDELTYTARAMNPEFVISVNHVGGLLDACQALHLPLLTWEIDPSTAFVEQRIAKVASSNMFTYNRELRGSYEEAGYDRVCHLPLATNPKARFPVDLTAVDDQRYISDVSFVGTSMVENSQRCEAEFASTYATCFPEERLGSGAVLLRRLMEMQRQSPSRFITPRLLERLSPEFRTLARELNKEDPAMLAGEIAGSEKRLATLANIASYSPKVWGDPNWEAVVRYGAEYMGYAGHFYELNKIYSGAKINVDINRIYQMNIVPMRVFDVLACGGFLIAEYSPELAELFELGVHLETWRDFGELQDKIRWYLSHEKDRQEIARAGREWVLQRHTIEQRVARMINSIGESGASAGRVA